MKILVIGASGLLAKPVVKHFDQNGHQLRLFSRSIEKSMYSKEYEIQQGDVFNKKDLEKAIDGCDAIHTSISKLNEEEAVKSILDVAKSKKIKLISFVSGASVRKENTWFPMIHQKFQAEQAIAKSGIPYIIFRPTWFMESLPLMVRNGKASVIGKQVNPIRIIAADDFARMLVNAYKYPESLNRVFYIYGPEKFLLKEAIEKYCKVVHPEIKKVSTIPTGLLKFIGLISANKELKEVASMFAYFEKATEGGSPDEANLLLGKPEIKFSDWLLSLKK